MIRHEDALYPAARPPADFADRVVVAVLRARRGAERRSALLSIASVSLAAIGALMCVVVDLHRGAERERANVRELAQEEQAMQARLDAHAEKLSGLLRAVDGSDDPAGAAESPLAAEPPREPSSLTPPVQPPCTCDPRDPPCACFR